LEEFGLVLFFYEKFKDFVGAPWGCLFERINGAPKKMVRRNHVSANMFFAPKNFILPL
jgi:hypothetical protein